MTTVFDVSLQMIKHVTDVLEGVATDGSATYLKDTVRLIQENEFYNRGTVWIKGIDRVAHVNGHASNKLTFDPLGAAICTQQVETATVVGTIGVAGAGNATVVVTAAALPNSPKTLSVAVANNDTASQVATKIRTALSADNDISNFFTIGGSGADIILTTKTARANDSTMNLSTANGTSSGLTAAPTSADTTASVAGPRYAVIRAAFPWEQIVQSIVSALDETYVSGLDTSLTGDGTTLEFTLPAGVSDVYHVELQKSNGHRPPSHHFDELNGKLIFDYGCAPYSGDVIRVHYRKRHDDVSLYSDTISNEINRQWLALAAARNLLFWGIEMYGRKNSKYLLEDRLNKVLNELKGKVARMDGPTVMMHAGG